MDAREFKQMNKVPQVCVPQKIILCIDKLEDFNSEPFEKHDASSSGSILKNALSTFVNNKHGINDMHEFAVLTFSHDKVEWVQDFTNDAETVVNSIKNVEFISSDEIKYVSLTRIFKEIKDRVDLPELQYPTIQIPSHIVQVILFYNSSFNVPNVILTDESVKCLFSSDYFFCDTVYLHDSTSDNNVTRINKSLQSTVAHSIRLGSTKKNGYIFETSRKYVQLLNYLAELLAHPLLRMEQDIRD